MKLTKYQVDRIEFMKTNDAIFAKLEYTGNKSDRKYQEIRYCQKNNINVIFNKGALCSHYIDKWVEQDILEKKLPYIKENGKNKGALVTEYHLKN